MMLDETAYALLLATVQAAIAKHARKAQKHLIDWIRQQQKAGALPHDVINLALREFSGEYYDTLAKAYSAVLGTSLGPQAIQRLPVGPVSLSDRLYQHQRVVAREAESVIRRHAQGMHSAQKLAMELYEGYGFKDKEVLKLNPRHPKLPKYLRELLLDDKTRQGLQRVLNQVDKIKSAPLRAAYTEALRAWEQGAGQDRLERKLKTAFEEKMRYNADRIARTELHRAHSDQKAQEFMADASIVYVQVKLSPAHPQADICDVHAKVDSFGLGGGVYPKAVAPKPPFHPHCFCRLTPRWDLSDEPAIHRPDAERDFLRAAGEKTGARMAGSATRYFNATQRGMRLETMLNAGKDPLYHLKRVGEVGGGTMRGMKAFDDFYNGLSVEREFPVATLAPEDQVLLGAKTSTVWLSRQSLDDHKAKHPDIGLNDYRKVPKIIALGEIYSQGNRRFALLHLDNVLYRAAIKLTADGSKIYLLTLFRTTEELAGLQIRKKFQLARRALKG